MSQQRGAVSQQSTPQLKKHLMYNQHNTQASNPINYNNNQNHYQRQQQSFDHYSPLLIADEEDDQQKPNQFENNPQASFRERNWVNIDWNIAALILHYKLHSNAWINSKTFYVN